MIFLTVGTQLPFDRLVRAVDTWAASRGRTDVYAQIGPTDLVPSAIEWKHHLEPPEFASAFKAASLVVGHAGMGTIIAALQAAKPLVVLPRRAALREHRNDHQLATASRFANRAGIDVAWTEEDLFAALDRAGPTSLAVPISAVAQGALVEAVRTFVLAGE